EDVEQLRALVTVFVAANARRPALLRIINQEAVADGPRLDHLFRHYTAQVQGHGAEVLARLQARGRVRPGPAGLVCLLMTLGGGGPTAPAGPPPCPAWRPGSPRRPPPGARRPCSAWPRPSRPPSATGSVSPRMIDTWQEAVDPGGVIHLRPKIRDDLEAVRGPH